MDTLSLKTGVLNIVQIPCVWVGGCGWVGVFKYIP